MKLKNIVDAAPSLQSIAGQYLPPRLSYKLARLLKKTNSQLETYDILRRQIMADCGTFDGDGLYAPTPGKIDEINRRLGELVEQEADEVIEPVHIPAEEADKLSLSPNDILRLEGLVEIEYDKED